MWGGQEWALHRQKMNSGDVGQGVAKRNSMWQEKCQPTGLEGKQGPDSEALLVLHLGEPGPRRQFSMGVTK